MKTLSELVEQGILNSKYEKVTDTSHAIEAKHRHDEGIDYEKDYIVIDGFEEVYVNPKTNSYWSREGNNYAQYSIKGRTYTTKVLNDKGTMLETDVIDTIAIPEGMESEKDKEDRKNKLKEFKEKKEVNTMAKDIKSLLQNIQAKEEEKNTNAGTIEGVNKLNSFDSVEAPQSKELTEEEKLEKQRRLEEKKKNVAQRQEYVNTIETEAADVKLADSTKLKTFNHEYSRVLGYLTGREEICVAGFRTNKYIDKDNPKAVYLKGNPNTPAPGKASQYKLSDLKYDTLLTFKQSRPTKAIGVFVEMPVGGNIPMSEFQKEGEIKYEADTTPVRLLYSIEDFTTLLGYYLLNGEMKEHEDIFPKPSNYTPDVIKLFTKTYNIKANPAKNTKARTATKIIIKPATGRNLIVPGNYIPRVTYKALDIYNLRGEEVEIMNNSIFGPLINKPEKFGPLLAEYKQHIKIEDGKISSDYIAEAGSAPEKIVITPYYDKNASPLTEALFAVKDKQTSGKYTTVTCDITKKADLQNPEKREFLSINKPQYQHLVSLIGEDLLKPERLLSVVKKSSNSKGDKEKFQDLKLETLEKASMKFKGKQAIGDVQFVGLDVESLSRTMGRNINEVVNPARIKKEIKLEAQAQAKREEELA